MLEGIIPQHKAKEYISRDGARIFYREWEGRRHENVIVYLHGLESHSGWFIETGNLLNRKGFHVYALDRRGSGASEGQRGHMDKYQTLIEDVKEFVEKAKGEHPGKMIYLMGLCWGGKIAVTFAAYHGDLIDGLILITPAIETKVDLPLLQKLEVLFSVAFRPLKLFNTPIKTWMFTRNQKYRDFIEKDELKLKKATARFFFETQKMNMHFNSIAHKVHIPVLVLLAGDDVIVDNKKIKKWFANIGSKDKMIKLYPDHYHSLQFEDAKNLINYIANWIRREENLIGEEHIER